MFAWSPGFQAESSRSLLLMLLKDESSTSKHHKEHKRMFDFPDVHFLTSYWQILLMPHVPIQTLIGPSVDRAWLAHQYKLSRPSGTWNLSNDLPLLNVHLNNKSKYLQNLNLDSKVPWDTLIKYLWGSVDSPWLLRLCNLNIAVLTLLIWILEWPKNFKKIILSSPDTTRKYHKKN